MDAAQTQYPLTSSTGWAMAENLISNGLTGDRADRMIVLYGPPGTGKTSWAIETAKRLERAFHVLPISPMMWATEARGGMYPNESGGMEWIDGPATAAARNGDILIADEIDQAGNDLDAFLSAVAGGLPFSLPNKRREIILPSSRSLVVGTMNGVPEDLSPRLADRAVFVRIDEPSEAILEFLAPDLRDACRKASVAEVDRRISPRDWVRYMKYRDAMGAETAADAVFGIDAPAVLNSLAISGHAQQARSQVAYEDETVSLEQARSNAQATNDAMQLAVPASECKTRTHCSEDKMDHANPEVTSAQIEGTTRRLVDYRCPSCGGEVRGPDEDGDVWCEECADYQDAADAAAEAEANA